MKTAKEILQSHYAFPIERNQSAGYNFRWGHIIDFMEEYALQFHPKEMTEEQIKEILERYFKANPHHHDYFNQGFKKGFIYFNSLLSKEQQPEQQGD